VRLTAPALAVWLALVGLPAAPVGSSQPASQSVPGALPAPSRGTPLASDLDRIFDDAVLRRALVAARVDRLSDGRVLYSRNADALVMPASNMKIVTVAVAAATLGWNYRYDTRLEAVGTIADGVLHGDLVVTGSGDPSIGSPDGGHAPVFLSWADALRRAGVGRIEGRIVGDDDSFEEQTLGAGWAWDYLAAGYAAPTGALNYNENSAGLTIVPGDRPGDRATVTTGPPGHGLDVVCEVTTGLRESPVSIAVARLPGQARLILRGQVPQGGPPEVRTVAVDNPTSFFVDALRLALESRGIDAAGGAWDIDDLPTKSQGPRRTIAVLQSVPLSALAGYAMKVSQNQYGEILLKTLGRAPDRPGSIEAGRTVVRETLASWGIPADSIVMYDGSGLSRYNYVTASTVVSVLSHVWNDDGLRGPFVSELPVGGLDGSLELRMRRPPLLGNVQAKTGTISNVRALSGFLRTNAGEKLVFSMIANHFTAPNADVDAIVERALNRLVEAAPTGDQ